MINLMQGEIVKNNNGQTFRVISTKGEYALMQSEEVGNYVVAFHVEQLDNGLIQWSYGSYYKEKEESIRALMDK